MDATEVSESVTVDRTVKLTDGPMVTQQWRNGQTVVAEIVCFVYCPDGWNVTVTGNRVKADGTPGKAISTVRYYRRAEIPGWLIELGNQGTPATRALGWSYT